MVAAERRDDLLAALIGLVGAATWTVSMMVRAPRLPDPVETCLLYQRAAEVGRDRANADTALVTDRLAPLVCAPDGPQGDELVLAAARRLVAWAATGRPDDGTMADVEATFARWAEVQDTKDHSPALISELNERYIEAWTTTLST